MTNKKRDHKIYKYTNLVNGKVYIGRTCQSLVKRAGVQGCCYKQCTYFWRAIQKYSWENFRGEILEEGLNDTEAAERELFYIEKFDSTNKDKGYNLRDSDYRTYTDETREKMRRAQTGKKMSEEVRRKISEKHKGRKMPESLKQKLLAAHLGKRRPKEVVEKVRQANLGKKRSEEYKKWLSEFMKGRFAGDKHPNFGKKMSDEQKELLRSYHAGTHLSENTKKKLSEALKGKGCTRIFCVETKTEYPSIVKAANETGIKRSNISWALRSQGTAGGFHWQYIDKPKKRPKHNCVTRVLCLETGIEYFSIKEAERLTGISRGRISKVINSSDTSKTAGGFHWKRIEEPVHRIRRGGKRIKCVETGNTYNSLIEAAEDVGTSRHNIGWALKKGSNYTAKGYHWKYINKEDK